MTDFIEVADLQVFKAEIDPAKAQAMIDDATAMASDVAPCITDATFTKQASVKAILRNAILRWDESGTGALSNFSQTAGGANVSETYDTRSPRRTLFWPSEIKQLQQLCKADAGGAFSVDTAPDIWDDHALACSLRFGGLYCSCGSDLTGGVPLYEVAGDEA